MIALQRHRQIVHRVTDAGAARVVDLARDLEVTEETIRRDLRVLSEQGVIARTHGGAVALETEDGRIDLPYDERHIANTPQKNAIAEAALELIEPGTVIALDASSTACQLAKLLPDQPLTVVTNSLMICSALANRRQIEVICTGGTFDPEAMAFSGMHAIRTLETLNIQQFFFSCRGIDLRRGLSEANDRHAAVKLRTLESAQRCILMADTSKLGLASTVFFAPVEIADHVILDRSEDPTPRKFIDQLRNRNLQVDEAPVQLNR
ncbi:MAG: DeoR/GlpR family DNA-binding transcription regulator [Planctomycetota bacterium]